MLKKLSVFVLSLAVCAVAAYAGTTGKLSGRVINKDTGEPLPGVNVMLTSVWMNGNKVAIEKMIGAVTDGNGDYYILNIPAGLYSVRFSMMGYSPTDVDQISVSPDLTRSINMDMIETTLQTAEAITVIAERELIRKDVTASQTINDAQQISSMPVNSVDDVLSTNSGAVFTSVTADNVNDAGIHLRGGRSGEIVYLIDGIDVTNNMDGSNGLDVSTDAISSLAMLTGGYNAEYGRAMSGVVNITTKEGSEEYHGRASFDTDKLGENSEYVWDQYNPKMNLSGPVPFLKFLKFAASYEYSDSKTYFNISKNTRTNRTHDFGLFDKNHLFNFKLNFDLLKNFKVTVAYVGQQNNYKNYNADGNDYKPIHKDYTGHNEVTSDLFYANITHMLSNATFYELKVGSMKRQNLYFNKFKNPADYVNFLESPYFISSSPDYFPEWNSNYEFYSWIVDTTYDDNGDIAGIDTLYHALNDWYDFKFDKMNIKFDISSQINKFNLLKTGIEFIQYDIYQKRISDLFLNGVGDVDDMSLHALYYEYEYKPIDFSAYVQDKLEYEDMIINFGLRYEYRDSKGFYFPDKMDPFTWKKSKGKGYLAPRLAFSFPITERAVMRFSYGIFYQYPEWERYYDNTLYKDGDVEPTSQIGRGNLWDPKTGNGDLKPQKTANYEVGIEMGLSRDLAMGIVAYYKDIYDLVSSRHITTTPYNYTQMYNADYGNSKGIELNLTQRWGKFFSGKLSYTFSRAEGNAATYNRGFWIAYQESVYGLIPAKNNTTMYWDQPHTINLDLNFYKAKDWNVNLLFSYGSGLPFTLTDVRGEPIGEVYSNRKPWTGSLDLRASKDFSIGATTLTFYVYATNLLDKQNIYSVYSDTGLPDETGNTNASLEGKHNPDWYGPRRNIKVGLAYTF